MDLIEFLRARLDEDEAEARAQMAGVCDRCRSWGVPHACSGIYVSNVPALHPERLLREVEAKRRILGWANSPALPQVEKDYVLDALAAVYSDHPDYPATDS